MVEQLAHPMRSKPLWSRPQLAVPLYCLAVILAIALFNLPFATDYVGADNDDAMRLVEVRDFLAGQNWFDMTQYRLGLDGGVLMHWSRLIDLPIAGLITGFGLVLPPERAEAAALLVWPLFLIVPLMASMALAGFRIGGPKVMHVSLGMTALLILTSNRFLPGAIDHHNVQLVLVAFIAAMLVDTAYRVASFALAGAACALALAIGAETTPLVAAVCLVVAVLWAWHGETFRAAAAAFALTVSLVVSLIFFSTVPPRLYTFITCDSLSLGYYGMTAIGGSLLFLSSIFASRLGRNMRFAILLADGAVLVVSALVLAPHCLRNPLSDLDPMLVSLWLNGVTEAQNIAGQAHRDPGSLGGFYAVGLFAMAICLFRALSKDRAELHAILLALISVCWIIALVQVRGAVFANLLAVLPLSLLIIDLRGRAAEDPDDLSAGFTYVMSVLLAVPAVWALGGVFLSEGTAGLTNRARESRVLGSGSTKADCISGQALRQLALLPPGTVAAPSGSGSPILRFTGHRVLSAPYHRNQGGMLTELHIGLATPTEAEAFIRGGGVSIIAFCPSDPQTGRLVNLKPDGLYATLKRGEVPAYLQPLPAVDDSGLTLFTVKPPASQ
ncbi:hypothetical protein HGO38_09655 [Rhizobium sp. CG5]|uniref:hypothetical protein n=1 Tax=Rhizobium sp. CG5 TaxID=2726076 RepID=UPI002033E111|nr:hypothetical protein [Rhizobium sp. CG5]MCM2473740.1 hypothetical protein [Rhizobium sp. CG5]